jgi:uncharacterized protein YggE
MTRLAMAVCLLLSSSAVVSAQAPAPTPVIVTQGEATLKRPADRAWLTISTEARDPNAANARKRNAEAMTSVQATLKSAGLPSNAIRTAAVSVSPEFDYNNGRSTLRGYVARNQVEVRVDNLDRLADVIDAVTAPKTIAVSLHGPRFDLKDERAARNEALRAAVEDAMSRAQAVAAGAKRSLGGIIRIDENSAGATPQPPVPIMMRAQAGSSPEASTPINAGEIEVQASVRVTFEIAK